MYKFLKIFLQIYSEKRDICMSISRCYFLKISLIGTLFECTVQIENNRLPFEKDQSKRIIFYRSNTKHFNIFDVHSDLILFCALLLKKLGQEPDPFRNLPMQCYYNMTAIYRIMT